MHQVLISTFLPQNPAPQRPGRSRALLPSAILWRPGSTAAPPPLRGGSLSGLGPGSSGRSAPGEGYGRPGSTVITITITSPRHRPATSGPATPRCSGARAAGGSAPGDRTPAAPPLDSPVARHSTPRERGRCTTGPLPPPVWPWQPQHTGMSITITMNTITTTTTMPHDIVRRGAQIKHPSV